MKSGADITSCDMEGMTPLHLAVDRFENEVAMALVEAGVSVNEWERCGWTPLHIAVDRGQLETVMHNSANF